MVLWNPPMAPLVGRALPWMAEIISWADDSCKTWEKFHAWLIDWREAARLFTPRHAVKCNQTLIVARALI